MNFYQHFWNRKSKSRVSFQRVSFFPTEPEQLFQDSSSVERTWSFFEARHWHVLGGVYPETQDCSHQRVICISFYSSLPLWEPLSKIRCLFTHWSVEMWYTHGHVSWNDFPLMRDKINKAHGTESRVTGLQWWPQSRLWHAHFSINTP